MVVPLVVRSQQQLMRDSRSVSKVDGLGTKRQEQEQPEMAL